MTNRSGDIREKYFNFLYSKIGARTDQNPNHSHLILAEQMYETNFIWSEDIPLDENRAKDGKDLRDEFVNETGLDIRDLYGPCTFLEFLVALADRTSYWSDHNEGVCEWFWRLCDNAGLQGYTDDVYTSEPQAGYEVDEILKTIIYRMYKPNGDGGLFPLRNPKEDQRRVEIWYQMNAYLQEDPAPSH